MTLELRDPPLLRRFEFWLVFLLALTLRLTQMGLSADQLGTTQFWSLVPDSQSYVQIATDFLTGANIAERKLFGFGPGYGAFLALFLMVFGRNAVVLLLFQALLSSLSCLLVVKLARALTGSRPTALVAGLLAALSYTAISLSALVLSDTLFFFVFLSGFMMYLHGLRQRRWRWFLGAGLLLGGTVLIRAIAQLWPIMMLLFAVPYIVRGRRVWPSRRTGLDGSLLWKVLACVLIVIAVEGAWVIRNQHVQGIPALTSGGSGGMANVAAFAVERMEGKPYRDVRYQWQVAYQQEHGLDTLSLKDQNAIDLQHVRTILRRHPREFVTAYLSIVWENLTVVNQLPRVMLPEFDRQVVRYEYLWKDNGLNYVCFGLSMLGFLVLVTRRRWRVALILGGTYAYFAAMIGFTRWQGSRLFFPGQIAWAVLVAVAIVTVAWLLSRPLFWLRRYLSGPLQSTVGWLGLRGRGLHSRLEQSRYYLLVYAGVIAAGLCAVFAKFVFSNDLLRSHDILNLGVFFRHFLWGHVTTYGTIPGWDPYTHCGLPFVDAIHGAVFYPLQWIDLLVGGFRIIFYNFMLHYFLAGIFAYLAARQLGLSKPAASMTGVSYMFAPCLLSWVLPGHDGKIYVAALFPLVVLFLSRVWERRRLADAVFLGVTLGAVILTAHLQMAYYVLWAVAFFVLWKTVPCLLRPRSLRHTVGPLTLVVVGAVLGVAISSIQLLPSYQYLTKHSVRGHSMQGLEFASRWSLNSEELAANVVPEFCGCDHYVDAYWGKNRFKDNSESVGLVPLFFAAVALLLWKRRDKYLWVIGGLLALIYSVGTSTPLFRYMVAIIPYAGSMRAPSVISFLFCFAVAVLAGMGVDSARKGLDCALWRRRLLTGLLWIVPLALLLLAEHFTIFGEAWLRQIVSLFNPSILPSEGETSAKWAAAIANLPNMQRGFWLAAAYAALASIAVWRGLRSGRNAGWHFVPIGLALIANGFFAAQFIQPENRLYDGFKANDAVRFLRQQTGPYRIVGFATGMEDFRLDYHGMATTGGLSSRCLDSYSTLAHGCYARDYLNERFANLTGTRYVITPLGAYFPRDTVGPRPLDTAAELSSGVIYENPNCFPRCFLAGTYTLHDDLLRISKLVRYGSDDLRRGVYLEEAPPISVEPDTTGTSSAEITCYSPDSIEVRISTPVNQLLVLTDNYYPAWHAYVDGMERPVLRADCSFRAVAVPAGSRQVAFVYKSSAYRWGKRITLFSLAVAVVVLVAPRLGRFRRRSHRNLVVT